MKYDTIEQRNKLVKQGILKCNDLGPLRIYNYVKWCKDWNPITLNSRGIIYNLKTGKVVAQPFPKFFNLNQRQDTQEHNLPWRQDFRIFHKEDGWLGILYRFDGKYKIATKGSFNSMGAIWASEYLKNYNLNILPDDVTLLFEIINPHTKIIVDYNNREDLILLAAYNRRTGEEYSWQQILRWGQQFGFTTVKSYNKNWLGYCRGKIKYISGKKLEGFVIRFENGLRIKIKSPDYFRRAAILMALTPLNIWKTMFMGKVSQPIFKQIDEDYHDQLYKISEDLEAKYYKLMLDIKDEFDKIKHIKNRAQFSILAQKLQYTSALFGMLDNKINIVDQYIMKKIRPNNNIIKE